MKMMNFSHRGGFPFKHGLWCAMRVLWQKTKWRGEFRSCPWDDAAGPPNLLSPFEQDA
jgi:hypothetical protein